jgi:hypothetical protein
MWDEENIAGSKIERERKNRKSFDFIIKCLTEEMRDGSMEKMTQTKPEEKQTLEDKYLKNS